VSYTASAIECGWCAKEIGDGGEVACRKCYEELERKVGDLEKEVERLTEKNMALEAKLEEAVQL
jgi:predicted RNase H-like nuclease (RuvC/YqgF family)